MDTKIVVPEEQPEKKPQHFTWSNVCFTVPVGKHQEKTLIQNMTGGIEAGQVVAIMGGSGAGKSTLLNTLAGRIGPGTLQGDILVDGKPRNNATWKLQCAYVEQDDILFKNLTVFETLYYSAILRLPKTLSKQEKVKRVEQIIAQLGLEQCKHTRIGDEQNRGISGGERKRVAIGVELVTNPHILFLDEPTSGLDAFNAYNAMEAIKNLAKSENKIVLMTIHQPRTDILELFDKIILLSAGKTLWFGDLDGAIEHFDRLGYPLPPKTNPSDFFLDTITVDARTPELFETSSKRIQLFYNSYEKSVTSATKTNNVVYESQNKVVWPSTWLGEFSTLLGRNLLNNVRDFSIMAASFSQALFISFLISILYWRVGNDAGGIQNRLGVFFFITINLTFGVVLPSINVFPEQKRLIKRERAAGSYRSSSAYLAKWISNIPLVVLGNIIMAVIVYWTVGLQATVKQFLTFVAIVVAHGFCANSFGLMIGAAVPNATIGQIVAPMIIIILMLFGGLLLNLDAVPVFLRWIQWISLISYSYKAFAQNEFNENLVFKCSPGAPCFKNGLDVVSTYSLNNPSLWSTIAINVGFAFFYLVVGMLIFSRTSRPLMRLK
jgi:ABC-type multidrug transport system ATPase subunit/ABC-type multidrug transport system permease subunit